MLNVNFRELLEKTLQTSPLLGAHSLSAFLASEDNSS